MIPNKVAAIDQEPSFQNPFPLKGKKNRFLEKKDRKRKSIFGFFQKFLFSEEDFKDSFQGLGLDASELHGFLYSSGNRFD